MTWKFYVNYSAMGRYGMVLERDLLTELGLNLKFPEHVTEADDGPFNRSTTPMVDLGMYVFKYLNKGEITHEELFNNAYVEEVYESEHVRTVTKRLRVILDAKYEKVDLHKVMETQCQHLTMTQRNELLQLLQKIEDLFDKTLVTWITDLVDFELKEDAKPI